MAGTHVSMFGTPPEERSYTEEERRNLDVVARYRVAKVSDRGQFWAPGFKRHRAGFLNIAEMMGGAAGMTDDSIADKRIEMLHFDAKGDTVWGIWKVVGRHTGNLYGLPATDKPIDVIEVGLWKLVDGLITEAWYFGDDLGLLRQLGLAGEIGGT